MYSFEYRWNGGITLLTAGEFINEVPLVDMVFSFDRQRRGTRVVDWREARAGAILGRLHFSGSRS